MAGARIGFVFVSRETGVSHVSRFSRHGHQGSVDKQTVGLIWQRIGRFAERQGAWDVEGELVATGVKTIDAPDIAKPLA